MTHLGSRCGSIGRAVASDTFYLWFKSCHWQYFYNELLIVEKTETKKHEAGICNFLKEGRTNEMPVWRYQNCDLSSKLLGDIARSDLS